MKNHNRHAVHLNSCFSFEQLFFIYLVAHFPHSIADKQNGKRDVRFQGTTRNHLIIL